MSTRYNDYGNSFKTDVKLNDSYGTFGKTTSSKFSLKYDKINTKFDTSRRLETLAKPKNVPF